MRRPHKLSRRKSRKTFTRGAKRINKKNMPRMINRGGIRL